MLLQEKKRNRRYPSFSIDPLIEDNTILPYRDDGIQHLSSLGLPREEKIEEDEKDITEFLYDKKAYESFKASLKFTSSGEELLS